MLSPKRGGLQLCFISKTQKRCDGLKHGHIQCVTLALCSEVIPVGIRSFDFFRLQLTLTQLWQEWMSYFWDPWTIQWLCRYSTQKHTYKPYGGTLGKSRGGIMKVIGIIFLESVNICSKFRANISCRCWEMLFDKRHSWPVDGATGKDRVQKVSFGKH